MKILNLIMKPKTKTILINREDPHTWMISKKKFENDEWVTMKTNICKNKKVSEIRNEARSFIKSIVSGGYSIRKNNMIYTIETADIKYRVKVFIQAKLELTLEDIAIWSMLDSDFRFLDFLCEYKSGKPIAKWFPVNGYIKIVNNSVTERVKKRLREQSLPIYLPQSAAFFNRIKGL